VDLTIVTGTLNVTSLPDLFGVHQKLYLNKDENSTLIPVPGLLWKLIHDRTRNAGIMFLVVNNPFLHDLQTSGYIICDCVCEITWYWFDGWNRSDMKKGFVYCCTIDDFRSKTGTKPFSFRVTNLPR
jgi:hypothetical protein